MRSRAASARSDTETKDRRAKLRNDIRRDGENRGLSAPFRRAEYDNAAHFFADAGYGAIRGIKNMEERARDFFLNDIRRAPNYRRDVKEIRLLFELFANYDARPANP